MSKQSDNQMNGTSEKKRTEVESYKDLVIGLWADVVLQFYPANMMTKAPVRLGRDKDGLIVEWHYPDFVLTFARSPEPPMTYCIQKIEVLS